MCSVHLKLTVYFQGNKQRTLEKIWSSDPKNSSQLNSLCLGPNFIERKMSQHSLGKFCILKEGYVQIVWIFLPNLEIDQIVNVIDQIVNVIDPIVKSWYWPNSQRHWPNSQRYWPSQHQPASTEIALRA